jgi:kumamolisin
MSANLELRGSRREFPKGSLLLGPADPAEVVEITVYLRRSKSAMPLTAHPAFGPVHPSNRHYFAREGFGSQFGASEEDAVAVQNVLAPAGLQVIGIDLARRAMRVSGSVALMSRVFGIELGLYRGSSGSFRGRVGSLRLPPGTEERVVGVFGLDNRPQLRTHFRFAKGASVPYLPTRVGAAYQFPANLNGTGECIGLLEFGGGFRASDLQSFFASFGLVPPSVTVVPVDGASNAPTGSVNGPDAEVELDIELVGALAPGAKVVVYFAPNSDRGFLDALTTAIHDSVNRPNLLSISWGGPEESWTSQSMSVFNQACEDATAMGVTVIAAAGDSGATDGEPAGTLAVDFPASAPYVLACGGTRLVLSGDQITEELVWNDLAEGEGATGGGVSQVFALPSYQFGAGVPTGEGGFIGRGVPDVAGDADPGTGYAVFVDGSPMAIGGTSAVAPLWAGLLARMNQGLGTPVGFLQPLIYVSPESGTFHDITKGNNGGFDAGPGWDACTGLGSPDGAALFAALKRK